MPRVYMSMSTSLTRGREKYDIIISNKQLTISKLLVVHCSLLIVMYVTKNHLRFNSFQN